MISKSRILSCVIYFQLILFLSCEKKEDNKHYDFLELEINYSSTAKGLRYSDLIKQEVEIIPLSNKVNDQEYFHIAAINKLSFVDNKIFIFDNFNDRKIRVFNLSGDLVNTIGELGDGLGEYLQPMDFLLT